MSTGTVKWFNNAKGYGFIVEDDGQEDLFAHFSSIQMDGYKTLKAGQIVEFDTVKADKGYHAINIRTADIDVSPAEPNCSPEYHNEHNNEATQTKHIEHV